MPDRVIKRVKLEEEEEAEEKGGGKGGSFDAKLDLLLLKKRRIFLSKAVTDESVEDIIRKLWYLEFTEPGEPILFVINSPGGSVDAGFALWDQIQMITSPVTTLVTGLAASMGSILSLAGASKRRFATPLARIMIHQPLISGVIQGQATDLEIQAKEIIKTRDSIITLYADKTGQEYEVIEKTIDRDTWMSALEAKIFGLIDGIITSYSEIGF